MIVKSAKRQLIPFTIAQSALLPLGVNLLVGKVFVAPKRIHKPYISSKLVCWHKALGFY